MKKSILTILLLAICTAFTLAFDNSDVVGDWNCVTDTPKPLEFKLTFFEKDGRLYGKYITENQELIIHYIRILNGKLRFQTETRGLKIKYSCVIEGNTMNGSISAEDVIVKFKGEKEVAVKEQQN